MVEAFPLEWPEGYERTPASAKKYSQFKCTVAQARDGVLSEIDKLKGVNPIISSNVPVKRDGQMYGNTKPVDGDTGVAVYFTWDNEQYVLACDQYMTLQENLRAIEKSIDALRGLKRWGASDLMKRAFTGFKALPEHKPDAKTVFDLDPGYTLHELKEAYRSKAAIYHPDKAETGDANKFHRINQAYLRLKKAFTD